MRKNLLLSALLVFFLTFSYTSNAGGALGKFFSGIFSGIVVDALGKAYDNFTGKTDIKLLKKELNIVKNKIPELKESIDSLIKKVNSNTSIEEYMIIVKREEKKLGERISRNELRINNLEESFKVISNLERRIKKLEKSKPTTNVSKYDCINNDNIHKAAAKGQLLYVRKCLHLGVNPNIKERAGWTPMHSAARHGHTSIIKLLINYGGIISIPDITGRTPLDQAFISKNIITIKYLESLGASRR